MPPPDSLVQIRKITKDYRSLRPLRIESLDLQAGQTLALCGFDSMVLGALVIVVGVPIVARFIRERPVDHRTDAILDGATVREGLTSPVFWILVTVLFAQSIAQNGALTHMAALLTDRGVPESGAALALSAMGAASLLGRLTTGWLLDRFFAPRVGFCLLSIAAVGTYLLAGAQSLVVGVIAAALIGFGMGAEADVTPYILSRYLGLRSFALLYGFTWTAYAIAGAVGPILMRSRIVRMRRARLGCVARSSVIEDHRRGM